MVILAHISTKEISRQYGGDEEEEQGEEWHNTYDPRNILVSVAIYVCTASFSYVCSRAKTFSPVVRLPPYIYCLPEKQCSNLSYFSPLTAALEDTTMIMLWKRKNLSHMYPIDEMMLAWVTVLCLMRALYCVNSSSERNSQRRTYSLRINHGWH